MQLLGQVETKAVELPNALEFTASRDAGLIETLAIPAFTLVVLWWFWRTGNLWLRTISGVAAAFTLLAAVANRIQGGETRLRVTSDELLAQGNLGKLFSTHEKIAVSSVSSLRYDPGGDGISGLYARHGWRSTLLLPYLTPDQTNALIGAIHRKFPHIPTEPYSPFSISELGIFNEGSEITTLGLSDSRKEDQHR